LDFAYVVSCCRLYYLILILHFREGIKSEDTEQAQKELEKMKEILKESSNIPNVDEELAAAVLHGEKLLGRLDHAKKLISELKYSEVNLATTLGHPVPAVVNSPTQPINIGSNNQSSPPSSPRRSSTFTEKDRKIFELEKKLKELQGVNAKLKQELEEQTERANKAEEDFKILAEWAAQFQNSQEQSNQDEH
jgi:chromosome segregation ATPase